MSEPRIYLVLDNCFAIKRWVKPIQWMEIAKEIGFNFIEASTDNEIDPLFSPQDYMEDWFEEVKTAEKATGIKVINFYTGYQTYRTVGLAHSDERVRRRIIENWFKPIIKRIADLKVAGMGFYLFALSDDVLQNQDKYHECMEIIINLLAELSEFSYNNKIQISVEQMYSPHQPPWTIKGTLELLRDVYRINKRPMYTTIDVGHVVGQRRFLEPSYDEIEKSLLSKNKTDKNNPSIWLGSDAAYEKWLSAGKIIKNKKALKNLAREINDIILSYPYMFSEKKDINPFNWLEELACYSPIIHMQQTDGLNSSHAAFTPQNNKEGIIKGKKLLGSIARSYQKEHRPDMPPRVEDIYLSFEIFAANVDKKSEILTGLKQTLKYWRRYVPEDGLPLKKLLELVR